MQVNTCALRRMSQWAWELFLNVTWELPAELPSFRANETEHFEAEHKPWRRRSAPLCDVRWVHDLV